MSFEGERGLRPTAAALFRRGPIFQNNFGHLSDLRPRTVRSFFSSMAPEWSGVLVRIPQPHVTPMPACLASRNRIVHHLPPHKQASKLRCASTFCVLLRQAAASAPSSRHPVADQQNIPRGC